MVVSGAPTIEGDILDHQRGSVVDPTMSHAHIADPDRLWPNGVVAFEFDSNFPRKHRIIMEEVMRYIKEKVLCINFVENTEETIDYVLIYPGVDKCESNLGRVGGQQRLNLNRCFSHIFCVQLNIARIANAVHCHS